MKEKSPRLWTPVLLIFVIGGCGFWFGSRYQKGAAADKAPYRELEKFSKVLEFIQTNYVESINPTDLVEGALRGMLQTMDPHSAYLPPDVYREMKVETSGKFGGLGIEVTIKDGLITVVSPIDDTPAFKAGIKSGDQVIKIAGHMTKSLTLPEAVNLMRGKPGSKIALSVFRKGVPKPLDFELVRESIKIQSVKSSLVANDIGYLRVASFMERTGDDLKKAMDKLSAQKKLQGIVLDLRGNPGGLLDQAVQVVNLFVEEGPVVYTIGRDRSKKEVEIAQKGRQTVDTPLVVLVDGSSASASEIVAGALQDYGRGVIAGQQTFGKGSVQTVIPLGDDSGLKLTVSRYYTPSGRSIQVKGITPDVHLDYIEPKIVEEARRNGRRLREADLEGHFANEADPDSDRDEDEDMKKVEKLADEKPAKSRDKVETPPQALSLEERLKNDYMVIQAEGILRTMSVAKKGLKKPEFKLQDEVEPKDSKGTRSAEI